MRQLKKTLCFVSLLLLFGVSFATLEGAFFCVDEPATACSESQCCVQCQNLHTSNISKSTLGLMPLCPNTRPFNLAYLVFHEERFSARIERPPIA